MVDFSGISIDPCQCIINQINNQLAGLSGFATSYLRDRAIQLSRLTSNFIANNPPFNTLNGLFDDISQLHQAVLNQVSQGLPVERGTNLSQAIKCLGRDISNTLTDVVSSFDPANLFGDFISVIAGIEGFIPSFLDNINIQFALALDVCGPDSISGFQSTLNGTLGTLNIDPVTRTTNLSTLADTIGISGLAKDQFTSIIQAQGEITKISNNTSAFIGSATGSVAGAAQSVASRLASSALTF